MLLLCSHILHAQIEDHEVYLTANLCDTDNLSPLTQSLSKEIISSGKKSTIIINGDITSAPISTNRGKQQLLRFIEFINDIEILPFTNIIILTGDRDWNDNNENGYEAIIELNKYIKKYIKKNNLKNVELLFNKGCPGPKEIQLNSFTKVIAINSQWWNHKYKKPQPSDAQCKYITIADIMEETTDIIKETDNQNILIVAHHPMRSLGNYGGRFSVGENLKPFPILGSAINAYHSNVGGDYDLKNDRLKRFTYEMYNALYFRSNIIYASGHERNHQITKEIDNVLINSGVPEKGDYAPANYSTLLHKNDPGYIKICYKANGSVFSQLINLKTNAKEKPIAIFESSCVPTATSTEVDPNLSYIPCRMEPDLPNIDAGAESTIVLPGEGYEASWFKKLWLGEHHRPTWSTPVTVPYLKIENGFASLAPYKEGGGRQTISLKFEDENGKRYTFRSVDKQPRKALDYELRKSIIGRIFQDQTSAQHPFGSIPVASLLDHLDILHATPKLYVLPDTDALGPYQEKYGGMLGMLEENPSKKDKDGNHFADADDILKSNELFREMYEDNHNIIKVDEFVRARLFDILVGDWSKHEDNWKWAEYKTKDGNIYRPIPRDRDHVFSKWDGAIPWLADREWALPNTEGFDYKITGLKSLVYQARHLDRFVASSADLDMYLDQVKYIQDNLTDEVIENAIKTLPPESFAIEGNTIIEKLKYRRDQLDDHAIRYYKWVSDEVDVVGSVEKDYFFIYNNNDTLYIELWDVKDGSKGTHSAYQRKFTSEYTDLIKLYGLDNDDIFSVQLSDDCDIDLVLLGGEQRDIYHIKGKDENITVIDEETDISNTKTKKIKLEDNWHRKRYIYNRKGRKYNNYLPLVTLGYNNFYGLNIRSTVTWTQQRWDKLDYHMRHKLSVNFTSKGDYGLKYAGDIRHAYGKWDHIANLILANPDFYDSYYGQGNTTEIDPTLDVDNFYISTFNNYGLLTGVRRQFWDDSQFSISSGFDYYLNKRLDNTILTEETNLRGANEGLAILPVVSMVDLDLRDDQTFPRRGVRLVLSGYNGWITNRDYDHFATIGGSYEQYFTTYNKHYITLGIKLGGVKGIGEVPFYLQPRLGGGNQLRGYTSNRFIGTSMVYANTELRWSVLQNDDASIPYDIGVTGFFDIGKVTIDNPELDGEPRVWHKGYGMGFYVIPFDEAFTLSLYLSFSEENSFYPRFTIGTALN